MRSGCPTLNANIFIVPSWRRAQVLWQFNTQSIFEDRLSPPRGFFLSLGPRKYSLLGTIWRIRRRRSKLFADKEIKVFVYPGQEASCVTSKHPHTALLLDIHSFSNSQTNEKDLFGMYSKFSKTTRTSFTSTNVKLRLRFDVHLSFHWHSPEPHLTTWLSSDLPLTLTRPHLD